MMKAINSFNGKPMFAPLIFSILISVIAISCQEDSEVLIQEPDDEGITLAITDEEAASLFEEVEDMAMDVSETREESPDNRMSNSVLDSWRCGTITNDTINNLITIDFGEECTGPDGKTRSGKILVSYNKRLFMPGANRTITLENYVVDSIQVFGTKVITNQSDSLRDFITLNVQLIEGQVIWPDQTSATRMYDRTKTWIREANPLLDKYQIEGSVEGTSRTGVAYQVEIVDPLIYKRQCRLQGVFLPVEGIKDIVRTGKPDTEINYGESQCDNTVIITQSQGSKEVDVAAEIKRLRKLASR